MRYLTAGESHGKALTAIIEGLPAGLELDVQRINEKLRRRQGGYGRGGRMAIESDRVEFVSGLRGSVTLGSPVTLVISNRDWENWQAVMHPLKKQNDPQRTVTGPRPGHADLAGGIKYRQKDLRNILERSSARETAARVAVGAVAQEFLGAFGIKVQGQVMAVGPVKVEAPPGTVGEELYDSPFYCPDPRAVDSMKSLIDEARARGDTLGGIFQVVAEGVPPGLGSHVHWDRRLDGRLAQAVMSIPAVKGVEIGLGFESAVLPGSQAHDEIDYSASRGFHRRTNRAGGLEGGITNGETLVIRGAMKPIPTLGSPLDSVDVLSKEKTRAAVERSDVCAVPAAAVVAEASVAWVLAAALLEKFGGDHLEETLENYRNYLAYVSRW
ncbi:MAG: chorismate synthase [Peptococcaceae bacterium]|nr:chorismate synthase [Peptococcaceae bacterium]